MNDIYKLLKGFLRCVAFFLFLNSVLTSPLFADSSFDISSEMTYSISEDGVTIVDEKIQIKNKTDFTYTPSYTASTGYPDIENIKVFNKTKSLPFEIRRSGDLSIIDISFPDRIAGIGKTNEFTISFTTKSIARKKGNIWEVTIPGSSEQASYTMYNTYVKVPPSFPKASIIKPFKRFDQEDNVYFFNKQELGTSGVTMLFGDYQFYSIDLTYHLENPNLFPIKTEIALPPSTAYQEILIDKITPHPIEVYVDEDGNWLAIYSLVPQQKITVKVKGMAKLHANPQKATITQEKKASYLKAQEFWEVFDDNIQNVSKTLKNPNDVYSFVAKHLTYNFDKASDKNSRLGGKKTLQAPTNSVCLEFTDLFVTLARASKIPARSIEGYAYTDDSRLRPRSLVKDILHAWPEYYDESRQSWVMVDPTWGNTTKGADYFNTFDLDHIAFVIKGKDSTYPIPAGGYKESLSTKDILISLATEEDFNPKISFELHSSFPESALSGFGINGKIAIKNTGNAEIKGKTMTVTADHQSERYEFLVDSVPPYSTKSFPIKLSRTPFLTNKTIQLTMKLDKTIGKAAIHISILPESVYPAVLGGVLFATVLVVAGFAIKIRRLSI